MKTITKLTFATPLLAAALLLVTTSTSHAQYARRTPDQIMRQAQQIQERQQMIERVTQEFTRAALDIANTYQQQKDEERVERQRQLQAEADERRQREQDNNSSNQDNQ